MTPGIKWAFDLIDDCVVELPTENRSLKNKIGSYDEKWLEESQAEPLKEVDDEKRENLNMSRMENQMKEKQY